MDDRKRYIDQLDAQVQQWRAELERLEAEANKAQADARVEYEQRIRQLSGKPAEAESKVNHMREAQSDAWQSLKDGMEQAVDDLKTAFSQARDKMTSK